MAGPILYNSQPATSDAALYTATSDTTISKIIAYNTTGGAATVTLSIHRSLSGTVETIATALSIGASAASSLVEDRLEADEEILLLNGDSLHGLASAGSTINVLVF
jgi:hypothetical protein